MKNPKNYHGYLALPRHVIMLQHDLGQSLFGLYLALIINARWHRGNPHFSHIVGTQIEIAEILHISQSSLSRGLEKLKKKNQKYVIKHKNYIVLGYLPLFTLEVASRMHSTNYADLHELYSDMHKINAVLQGNYADSKEKYALSQDKQTQKPLQRLKSSSNDNYSSFPITDEDIEDSLKEEVHES